MHTAVIQKTESNKRTKVGRALCMRTAVIRKGKKKTVIDILTFRWFFLSLVYFYKKCVSPLLPRACIYYPTCSDYMLDALKEYGVAKGIILGLARLSRCVPWRKGGFDPLPYNPKGEMKWLY